MTKNLAGIDIGYSSTKVVSDNDLQVAFLSAVGSPEQSRFGVGGKGETAIIFETAGGGRSTYFVGDQAVTQSRLLQRREDRDWIQSLEYELLMCTALSELPPSEIVKVVTGLPVAFYDDRGILKEIISGQSHFDLLVNGNEVSLDVEVEVLSIIPQPFGSLLDLALDTEGKVTDLEIAEGTIGVIDVGGKTTNILTASRMAEIAKDTTSVNVGGWDIVRTIGEEIRKEFPTLDLRDHEIAYAIRNREVKVYGKTELIGNTINVVCRMMAESIIAQATQMWNAGARLDKVIVTGGGAHLLYPAIAEHFPHAVKHPEPVFGNAMGYYKYARMLEVGND